jgi:predicted transposase YdaD
LPYDIWHDGRIWEAPTYDVPFLWEFLKTPLIPNKLVVANLIIVMAREEDWYLEIIKEDEARKKIRRAKSQQGKNLNEEIAKAESCCNEDHLEIA